MFFGEPLIVCQIKFRQTFFPRCTELSNYFVSFLDGYWIIENFFLLPMSSILGQLVEEADKKNVIITKKIFT